MELVDLEMTALKQKTLNGNITVCTESENCSDNCRTFHFTVCLYFRDSKDTQVKESQYQVFLHDLARGVLSKL